MPLPKTNLRTLAVSLNHVNLVWDNSLTKLNDIEDKVQYRKMDSEKWQTSSVVCQQRTATIRRLSSATRYQFRIHAPGQIFLRESDEPLEVITTTKFDFFLDILEREFLFCRIFIERVFLHKT